jgi:hypothetical protein
MCDIYMQDRELSCSRTILASDGCPPTKWGDGVCDDLCGTAACNFDGERETPFPPQFPGDEKRWFVKIGLGHA